MRIPRLLTIVGPSAALYVLAARASLGVATDDEWIFALGAMAFAASPIMLLVAPPPRAAVSLAWIGVSFGVAIAAAASRSPVLALTHGAAWLAAASAVLGLATPRGLRTKPWRTMVWAVVFGAAAVTALAVPTPSRGHALGLYALGLVVASGALHCLRLAKLGSKLEGALTAFALATLAAPLAWLWQGDFPSPFVAAVEWSVAAVLWLGHLAWVDPERATLRRSGVPFVTASVASFAIGLALSASAPQTSWEIALSCVLVGITWSGLFAVAKRLTSRAAWTVPSGLVQSARHATRRLLGASTVDEIAVHALEPFQSGSGPDPDVTLYALQPPIRIRLDEGNRPLLRSVEPPEALVRGVMDLPEPVLDALVLRDRIVREPAIRGIAEVMEHADLGLVLRCAHLDHVEGLLAIPRGERREPLGRAEIRALVDLGDSLGGVMATALAQRRAESHIQELSAQRRDAEDRVSSLEDQIAQLRRQSDVFGGGLVDEQALHVAYSASMRRLQTRAIELAGTTEPAVLLAGAGTPVLPIARFIHDRGARWQGPFAVRDCAAASFSREWVESAHEGTLVLRDLPALAREDQEHLVGLLADLNPASGEARVLATTRVPIAELVRRDILVPSLADVFPQRDVEVPALRNRREDIPSLVLFAIDRACRVLATQPIGIEQDAMALLLGHDWPGDVAELDFIIESAVAKARDRSITKDDLPPLAWPSQAEEATFDGTYAEVERRTLHRALIRAGGNKSEAARMLGLKRTTFVDRLRRHGLEGRGGALGGSVAG
ncbi:MAG: helix-turn-helix domain-containing protein [Myxococcota bacterium]